MHISDNIKNFTNTRSHGQVVLKNTGIDNALIQALAMNQAQIQQLPNPHNIKEMLQFQQLLQHQNTIHTLASNIIIPRHMSTIRTW